MRLTTAGLATLLLIAGPAVAPTVAFAHDSFIVPVTPTRTDQPIRLQVTSSSFFPEPESAIRPDRVARVVARAAATPMRSKLEAGEVALSVDLDWPAEMTERRTAIVATVDLTPWNIDLQPDVIAHYMDEIGASPLVRAQVQDAVTRDGVLRETYTKHLKTFVCIETCEGLSPERPDGSALEFVNIDGAWTLLDHGNPRAGQPVFVVTDAQGRRQVKTDARGRLTLPDDLTGGIYLGAVILTPPSEPGGRFTSEWAALTFSAELIGR